MIDLNKLREHFNEVAAAIKRKEPSFDINSLHEYDKQIRALKIEIESFQNRKNAIAKMGKAANETALRLESIEISKLIGQKEEALAQLQTKFNYLYLRCPNLPADDVPTGFKEENKVVKIHGEQPKFDFEIRNHVEIAKELGWLDFDAAAKMSGSNFALYKSDCVKFLYALAIYMLNNNIKHGYSPILPPYLVTEKSLECAGNFPKFEDAVYKIEEDKLFLTPTSEVNLTNIYRDHIFELKDLPIRMTAWTSCFRREAGTYGSHERGLIRIHQFEKLELYSICEPHLSGDEQDRMIACAEQILKDLGLHYRISLLAAQDTSFSSAKTYDIEVWMPGQKAYYEVSSISNCTDFQARRSAMRYKEFGVSKAHLVNTLNGSSLALPRLMVAIIENYQQPDGTVKMPDILKNVTISL